MNLLRNLHSIFQDEEGLGHEEEVEAAGLEEDLDAAGLKDISDGRGQDSKEEDDEEDKCNTPCYSSPNYLHYRLNDASSALVNQTLIEMKEILFNFF
jgi:hypothetical protein